MKMNNVTKSECGNEELLMSAIQEGNYVAVNRLLNTEANINYKRKDGMTPLTVAVAKRDVSMVRNLLRHGCDVNIVPVLETNQYGDSALHLASIKGDSSIARILIEHGADVNVTSFGGRTPLMKSCFHGNHEVAEALISNGADVNQTDYQGMSGFLYSCSEGHAEIVQYLINNNANINCQNWKGETGLVLATKGNHYDVIKLLLSNNCDVNLATKPVLPIADDIPSGSTALHIASRDGYVKVARDLVQSGANINSQDGSLMSPLHYASSEGHHQVAKLLLECNCKINLQNGQGETPLFGAVENKRIEVVGLLLKFKANPNVSSHSQNNPLLKAMFMNCSHLVKQLILANCDVKFPDDLLRTQVVKKQTRKVRFNEETRKIMKIFIISGVQINILLRAVHEIYFLPPHCEGNTEGACQHPVVEKMTKFWSETRTLKHLCRLQIRKSIGIGINNILQNNNLPQSIKQYILLSEINLL